MFGELAPKLPGIRNSNEVWYPGAGLNSGIGGDGTSFAYGSYNLCYGNSGTGVSNALFVTNNFVFGTSCTVSQNDNQWNFIFGNGSSTGATSVTYSMAFGNTSATKGNYSLAFGNGCAAYLYGVAIGNNATASGNYGIALGLEATASGNNSVAIGQNSTANNAGSVVWVDSSSTANQDNTSNQFNLTFAGGYRLFTGTKLSLTVDANGNSTSNNFISGYTTTATAAGTTTLTVTSAQQQFFTGSTTQTLVLPVTSTLALGFTYLVVNNSTGVVTVESSGANTIQAMAAGTTALFTCILTSGTTAASWNVDYYANSGANSNITSMTGLTGYLQAPSGVKDSNGNVVVTFNSHASAVNYLGLGNSATGVAVGVSALGSDTNVGMNFSSKGSGAFVFGANSNVNILELQNTSSSDVNYIGVYSNGTGSVPFLQSIGSDTNIGMGFQAKGDGPIYFYGYYNETSFIINSRSSAVNYVGVINAATGSIPYIFGTGSDASVGLGLASKGGNFQIFDFTSTNVAALQFTNPGGYSTILSGSPTQAANYTAYLPIADGVANAPLVTNGSGQWSFGGTFSDVSGTISVGGFSGTPTIVARASIVGKIVNFEFSITGTSNASSFNITDMPYALNSTLGTLYVPILTTNSGVNGIGLASFTNTTITFFTSVLSSTWTASGVKSAYGSITYEAS